LIGVGVAAQWILASERIDYEALLRSGEIVSLGPLLSAPGLWNLMKCFRERAVFRTGLSRFSRTIRVFGVVLTVLILWTNAISVFSFIIHLRSTAQPWTEWVDLIPLTRNSRTITQQDCLRPYMAAYWNSNDNSLEQFPCTINDQSPANTAENPGGGATQEGFIGIADTRQAFQTYSNFSTENAVARVGNLTFLTPSNPIASVSYVASTMGMEMECQFINLKCSIWKTDMFTSVEAQFDCSTAFPGFSGNLSGTSATLMSRNNASMRYAYGTPENPFRLGIGTLNTANVTLHSGLNLTVSENDNHIYTLKDNLISMVLCDGTVYNVTYSFQNGTYTILTKELAGRDLTWLMTGPLVAGSALPYGVRAVGAAMDLATSAALAKANTSEEIGRFTAEGVAQVGVAFTAGVFSVAPSLQVPFLSVWS